MQARPEQEGGAGTPGVGCTAEGRAAIRGLENTGSRTSQPHPALLPTRGKGVSAWAELRALETVKLRPAEERLLEVCFTPPGLRTSTPGGLRSLSQEITGCCWHRPEAGCSCRQCLLGGGASWQVRGPGWVEPPTPQRQFRL